MKNKLDLGIIDIKPFVPSKDYTLSLNFYNAMGFSTLWRDDQLALMAYDGFKFFLQNFYQKEFAENFVMHLLVANADDWWIKTNQLFITTEYPYTITEPEDKEWGMREFTFLDPSGVLWRIANNI